MNSTEPNNINGANSAPTPQGAAGDPAAGPHENTEPAQDNSTLDNTTANEADAELQQLQEALDHAQEQLASGQDQYLRLKADLENQRRRMQKQIDDAHKYSVQRFVESLLPVIDSLEMGLQAQGDLEKIREGMGLTLKQFDTVMEKFSIEAINPEGEVFDPNRHQAVSQVASDAHDNNQVIFVMQKGYMLSGRVVRPAMVTVCKK